jgi:hypothetical protein
LNAFALEFKVFASLCERPFLFLCTKLREVTDKIPYAGYTEKRLESRNLPVVLSAPSASNLLVRKKQQMRFCVILMNTSKGIAGAAMEDLSSLFLVRGTSAAYQLRKEPWKLNERKPKHISLSTHLYQTLYHPKCTKALYNEVQRKHSTGLHRLQHIAHLYKI